LSEGLTAAVAWRVRRVGLIVVSALAAVGGVAGVVLIVAPPPGPLDFSTGASLCFGRPLGDRVASGIPIRNSSRDTFEILSARVTSSKNLRTSDFSMMDRRNGGIGMVDFSTLAKMSTWNERRPLGHALLPPRGYFDLTFVLQRSDTTQDGRIRGIDVAYRDLTTGRHYLSHGHVDVLISSKLVCP
jgi:hypothetical protein